MSTKPKITELTLLGKVIGTFEDWEDIEIAALQFIHYIPNALGKKFLRIEEEDIHYHWLYIDFTEGKIQTSSDFKSTEIITHTVDWSVFNVEE